MKNIRVFVSENFQFLEMKFSMYLNRRVFVMSLSCHRDSSLIRDMTEVVVLLTVPMRFFFGTFRLFKCRWFRLWRLFYVTDERGCGL